MTDIIDQIDALINEQLAAGEPETGYDFGDPQYPDCPHCHRGWHGLRITERIEAMHRVRQFDPDYRVVDDDTAVLCEGSEFIGPRQPTSRERAHAAWGASSTDYQSVVGAMSRRCYSFAITVALDVRGFHDPLVRALDFTRALNETVTQLMRAPVAPACLKPPPTIEFGPNT